MAVLEGAAALLLAKIYRRRTPRALVAAYNEYAKSHRTRQRMQNMRSGRVRRASLDAAGRHFDMNAMFDDLNSRLFAGTLRKPHLGWSTRGWRRQFGSFDPGPNQILLNRRMDRPEVPRYVVEYRDVSRDAARETSDAQIGMQRCCRIRRSFARRRNCFRDLSARGRRWIAWHAEVAV